MTRLQTEHQRLYLPPGAAGDAPHLLGSDGRVRALVLALGGPADWDVLAPVWRGVQADLDWPAPAIAVNGQNAFELWFSLAEPLSCAEAAQLLAQLQRRYLAEVHPDRVRAWPGADAAAAPPACPPFATGPERWAAFVTPDLPSVFGDDPALDFEPGADAQADLLARQQSITATPLSRARAVLAPAELPALAARAGTAPDMGQLNDPRAFLLAVMNDATAPLALRIEAARGLLQAPGQSGR